MAPACVILSLGLWSSISAPGVARVPLRIVCVSYLRPCYQKFALVISPRPLDFFSDAECVLSCLVAFADVLNEFPNVFGSGFVALDPGVSGPAHGSCNRK